MRGSTGHICFYYYPKTSGRTVCQDTPKGFYRNSNCVTSPVTVPAIGRFPSIGAIMFVSVVRSRCLRSQYTVRSCQGRLSRPILKTSTTRQLQGQTHLYPVRGPPSACPASSCPRPERQAPSAALSRKLLTNSRLPRPMRLLVMVAAAGLWNSNDNEGGQRLRHAL